MLIVCVIVVKGGVDVVTVVSLSLALLCYAIQRDSADTRECLAQIPSFSGTITCARRVGEETSKQKTLTSDEVDRDEMEKTQFDGNFPRFPRTGDLYFCGAHEGCSVAG